MSKGAATEKTLGFLHNKIATVFSKVLDKYEDRLDAVERLQSGDAELEQELLEQLLEADLFPNPAMLAAISKFLKDNEITMDSEEVDRLSDQERRLAERKKKRPDFASLTNLSVVADNG